MRAIGLSSARSCGQVRLEGACFALVTTPLPSMRQSTGDVRCRRSTALEIAGGLCDFDFWVRSSDNPADAPSSVFGIPRCKAAAENCLRSCCGILLATFITMSSALGLLRFRLCRRLIFCTRRGLHWVSRP